VLVTGPTGSGKSTTLYAALQQLDSKTKNVLTLEDPIEYELDGISQTQINTKKGMTFAKGLRNILRQAPDVIMVGEIRDQETAEMAIQAALTGHLVFSTLHTNDAASAVTRLLDLQIEPFLISSSLLGVLAQRLVRRICRTCRGNDDQCANCRGTGFRGRLGIFELLVVNDPIRTQIQDRADAGQIKKSALRNGMFDLRQDGIQKANAKETTMEEVYRVTSTDGTTDD
jgi:general secretion pathway protein E